MSVSVTLDSCPEGPFLQAAVVEVKTWNGWETPWVTRRALESWLYAMARNDRNSDWALLGWTILAEDEGLILRVGDGSEHEDELLPLIGSDARLEELYYSLSGWTFVLAPEEVV